MPYSTQDDLLTMISQTELAALTAETGDEPDSQVVAEAINRADAEIDAACGLRYTVPFAPAPERVKSLSTDLALYHLYSRRGVAPAVWRQKYLDALAFLKEVAGGQATLAGSSGEPPAAERQSPDFISANRVFSRDSRGEW
ncbi:MAG: gp436 family protein [Thermodesulfobacteriota bacterium]